MEYLLRKRFSPTEVGTFLLASIPYLIEYAKGNMCYL